MVGNPCIRSPREATAAGSGAAGEQRRPNRDRTLAACGSGDARRRRPPCQLGSAPCWQAAFRSGLVTISAAARSRRLDQGRRRGTNFLPISIPIVAMVAIDLLDMAVLRLTLALSQHHSPVGQEHGPTIPLADECRNRD